MARSTQDRTIVATPKVTRTHGGVRARASLRPSSASSAALLKQHRCTPRLGAWTSGVSRRATNLGCAAVGTTTTAAGRRQARSAPRAARQEVVNERRSSQYGKRGRRVAWTPPVRACSESTTPYAAGPCRRTCSATVVRNGGISGLARAGNAGGSPPPSRTGSAGRHAGQPRDRSSRFAPRSQGRDQS